MFGDFNRNIDKYFPNFFKYTLDWTYKRDENENIRTITDFFVVKNNSNVTPKIILKDHSNNATFAHSNHRLMSIRMDIPMQTERKSTKYQVNGADE